jgi:hypothetical protein
MRITDINIYRDGGSISFRVERDEIASLVWLDTPFDGEPRALRIISVPPRQHDPREDEAAAERLGAELSSVRGSNPRQRGDTAVQQLLADIARWWEQLPHHLQGRVRQELTRQTPVHVKPGNEDETMELRDLSLVIEARDYILQHYGSDTGPS